MSLAYCAQQQKTGLIIKWNPVITVSVCGEPWEVKHASSIHPQVCSRLNFLVCFYSWKTCSENTAILILSRFFFIFTLWFVFCLHFFIFQTTVDKYTLFISHLLQNEENLLQFLADSSTNVPMTMSQIDAALTSSSLTSPTGRDSRRGCWGLWLEWRRPEGNTTGKSGSPQVFLHTGIPRGA